MQRRSFLGVLAAIVAAPFAWFRAPTPVGPRWIGWTIDYVAATDEFLVAGGYDLVLTSQDLAEIHKPPTR